MSKLLVIPSSKEQITSLNNVDGFIIGIDGLSVNLPFYLNCDEVMKIINNNNDKDIFVSLNKNMHNSDLPFLREVLTKLNNTNVKGIIYYDISIVNLKEELGLNLDLVWNQEHMTNNYFTINYWLDHNVNYTWLSNDITLEEINEIRNNTKSKLMLQLFGYVPMFTSYRHLIDNYLKAFNLDKDSNYYMEKENKKYKIVDEKEGTTVYSNNIINGLEESLELSNLEYIILNSFNIDNDCFKKIVDMFNKVSINNVKEYSDEIKSIFKNSDKCFLYKETVYKVK